MPKTNILKIGIAVLLFVFCLHLNGRSIAGDCDEIEHSKGTSIITSDYRYPAGQLCTTDPDIEYDTENSSETVDQNDSATISVIGNNAPFTWSVSGIGFTLDNAKTTGFTNTLNADNTACGSATITVTGCDGTSITGYVRCTTGQWTLINNDVNQACTLTGAATSQRSSFVERIEGKYKQFEHLAGTLYDGSCDGSCSGCGLCITEYSCAGVLDTLGPLLDDGCCCKRDSGFLYHYCIYQTERRLYEWTCIP